MITLILTVLLYMGAGALAGILIYFAVITLQKILGRIKEFLVRKFGGTYFTCRIEKLVNAAREKAQKEGNVTKLDDLLKELDGKKGLIEAKTDANGKIAKGDLKILTTDEIDEDLEEVLDKRNGELIVVK